MSSTQCSLTECLDENIYDVLLLQTWWDLVEMKCEGTSEPTPTRDQKIPTCAVHVTLRGFSLTDGKNA